jgi:hypothetical protein
MRESASLAKKSALSAAINPASALFAPRHSLTIALQATGTKDGIRAYWMPGDGEPRRCK